MAMYNDKVMDHFMNPHNVGELESPNGVGIYGNPGNLRKSRFPQAGRPD